MRRIRLISALLILAVLLAGCTPAKTTVVQENGSYFLELDESVELPSLIGFQGQVPINFNTVKDMVNTIRRGSFTEEQLHDVATLCSQKNGRTNIENRRFEIINLDNIYYPVLPEGWSIDKICWYLDYYMVDINTPDEVELSFRTIKQSTFENYAYEFAHYEEKNTDASRTFDEETRTVTYRWKNKDRWYSAEYYTAQTSNGEVHIMKWFRYDHFSDAPSEDFEMVACYDGIYYKIQSYDEIPDVTLDLLSSFVIEKYEG